MRYLIASLVLAAAWPAGHAAADAPEDILFDVWRAFKLRIYDQNTHYQNME